MVILFFDIRDEKGLACMTRHEMRSVKYYSNV